ncbi:MAG: EamA family transporter [Armatimonadota bacterium]|nr:EamA family transporter [Armatimonadota bacterium]
MSDRTLGILLGLAASALWASVFVVGRYATAVRGVDPILTAAVRFSVGAAAAVVYLALAGRWRRLMSASRDLGPLAALGAVGIFGMGVLVFISTNLTTSINGALILNANAIFIAVFALLVGERVPAIRFIGLIIGLAGCAVTVMGRTPPQPVPVVNNLLGSLAALGGAICWAAYTVAGKPYVRRHGGPEAATVTLVFGAVLLIALTFILRSPMALRLPEALSIIYLGVLPTTVAMLMWYRALELVDASALGPTQYVAPPGATLLGWALLGEPLSWTFVAGAVAIIGGVYLATRPARPPA